MAADDKKTSKAITLDNLPDEYQKLLDKYQGDPLQVFKAYGELERKMSEQGTELGTLRKDSDAKGKALKETSEWIKAANPVVEWYQKNLPAIQQYAEWARRGQTVMNQPNTQPVAQSTASILTPEEQHALMTQTIQAWNQQHFAPWVNGFTQQVEAYGRKQRDEIQQAFEQREKASMRVLWDAIEKIAPKEKVDYLRTYHEKSMEYADPSKFNPMKVSEEMITAQSRIVDLEAKLKEADTAREKLEQSHTVAIGGNNSSSFFPKVDDKKGTIPSGKADALQRVLKDVTDKHGKEGVDALFGPAR